MPSPLNQDSILMFRLLADEQWHSYDEMKAAIARQVSPGRAFRRYEQDLAAKRLARNEPTYDTYLSEDERIEFGGKRIAQATLSKWAGKGIIIQTLDGIKRVKLKHNFWPVGLDRDGVPDENIKQSPAAAPEPEPKVENAVEDVPKEREPAPEAPGVGEGTKQGSEGSEVVTSTAKSPVPKDPRRADFLTRVLSEGVVGPIYGPDPASFHTRPLSNLSGPEEAITELEEAVPPEYSREDYLKAVEERFPQLVEPEAVAEPQAPDTTPVEIPPGSRVVTSLIMCTDCAGLIEDEAAHLQWHQDFVKREEATDAGLWNESRIREVIRDELGPILDRFQASMQGYLEEQFAQLSGLVVHFRGSSKQWTKVDPEVRQKG